MSNNKLTDEDVFLLSLAKQVSKRSDDPITKVGVVIDSEGMLIMGHNRLSYCDVEHGNWEKDVKHFRVIHAEIDAIGESARSGTPVNQGTIYCTLFPCLNCALTIIAAGITKVIAQKAHYAITDPRFYEPLRRFEECGVDVVLMEYPEHDEV